VINIRQGVADIANDYANVISKGPKALVLLSADDLVKLPDDDVDVNGEEDHREGTTLPNTRKNIGTLERFPSNLNKVKVILVKLHKASNKPLVETKERQAIPQIIMGKGRKGRREVE